MLFRKLTFRNVWLLKNEKIDNKGWKYFLTKLLNNSRYCMNTVGTYMLLIVSDRDSIVQSNQILVISKPSSLITN